MSNNKNPQPQSQNKPATPPAPPVSEVLATAAALASADAPAAEPKPSFVGKKLRLVAVHGDLHHLLVPGKVFTQDRPTGFVVDQFVQNQLDAGKLAEYVETDE